MSTKWPRYLFLSIYALGSDLALPSLRNWFAEACSERVTKPVSPMAIAIAVHRKRRSRSQGRRRDSILILPCQFPTVLT